MSGNIIYFPFVAHLNNTTELSFTENKSICWLHIIIMGSL